MKTATTILLLLTTTTIFAQIKTTPELLQASERYYNSLTKFSVNVREKYKTAIEERTTERSYDCFVDKPNKTELFGYDDYAYFVKSGNEFSLHFSDSSFTPITKKKSSIYASKYSALPFINFEILKQEISNGNVRMFIFDSTYQLAGSNAIYEFRKSDASLRRIYKNGIETHTKGFYYNELLFGPALNADNEMQTEIAFAEKIIKSNKKTDVSKPQKPNSINIEMLKDPMIAWFNSKPGSFAGKKIVIDFFFQGCYPCVLSYPHLNELNKSKDSNTIVIGVDLVPEDSLSAEVYFKKHDIHHPVIAGQMGKTITEQFGISTWPTFIVIDENGKIILREEGLAPGSFRKIRNVL